MRGEGSQCSGRTDLARLAVGLCEVCGDSREDGPQVMRQCVSDARSCQGRPAGQLIGWGTADVAVTPCCGYQGSDVAAEDEGGPTVTVLFAQRYALRG